MSSLLLNEPKGVMESKDKGVSNSKMKKSTSLNSSTSDQSSKPKKTKSRNGCLTCKKKRLKCGEEKPFCQNCIKKNIVCGGYSINFKWRDFSQTSTSHKFKDSDKDLIPSDISISNNNNSNQNENSNDINNDNIEHNHTHNHNHNHDQDHDHNHNQSLNLKANPIESRSFNHEKMRRSSSQQQVGQQMQQHQQQNIDLIKSDNSTVLQKALEAATLSVTGKSTQEIAIANALIASGKNPELAAAIASTLNGLANSVEIQQLAQQNKLNSANFISKSKEIGQQNDTNKNNEAPNDEDSNQDHSLLNSLADIASKVPVSPSIPLSPFNAPSTDLFLQQQQQQQQQQRQQQQHHHQRQRENSTSSLHSLNHEPLIKSSLSNLEKKDSPLNVFKEPNSITGFSPLIIPKSPLGYYGFTGNHSLYEMLTNGSNNDNADSPKYFMNHDELPNLENFNSPNTNSFVKLSPLIVEPDKNDLKNLETPIQSKIESPRVSKNALSPVTQFTPPFNNLMSILNSENSYDFNSNASPQTTTKSSTALTEISSSASEQQIQKKQQLHHQQIYSSLDSPRTSSPNSNEFPLQNPLSLYMIDEHLKTLNAFDQYTCGIMSMKNGPSENPWRTFLLPMSAEYPVMRSAISAMTCFHIARGDVQLRSQGMKHMKNAIVELVHGLSGRTTPPDVALATCLALAMGEAWDRHVSTGIAHLKGAKSMIVQVLNNLQGKKKRRRSSTSSAVLEEIENSSNSIESKSPQTMSRSNSFASTASNNTASELSFGLKIPKELQFLVNAWVYFDVLARMTSEPEEDETDDKVDDNLVDDGSDNDRKRKRKKSSDNDSMSIIEKFYSFNLLEGDEVDPLLGVAQKMFPIIGQVATLISKIRKEAKKKNSLLVISKAVDLKKQLENWKLPVLKNYQIEDPLFDLSSAVATAESYRYATLLYLHQAVPEIPSPSSHSLAENIMMLLASISTSSRTCVTHMFPLLVASCEAKPGEEREFVRERWELLSSKMWIGTIDRALEVVKEVWARKDALKKKKEQELHSDGNEENLDENSAGEEKLAYGNVRRRISRCVNGNDDDLVDDDENKLLSWTHWTTVMKEWGWEVLLA